MIPQAYNGKMLAARVRMTSMLSRVDVGCGD